MQKIKKILSYSKGTLKTVDFLHSYFYHLRAWVRVFLNIIYEWFSASFYCLTSCKRLKNFGVPLQRYFVKGQFWAKFDLLTTSRAWTRDKIYMCSEGSYYCPTTCKKIKNSKGSFGIYSKKSSFSMKI